MIPRGAAKGLALAALLSSSCAMAQGELVKASYSMEDARSGAQLRSEAAIIVPILMHPCRSSSAMELPAARYVAFKSELMLDRQRMDLAIVEADHAYMMSLVDIACPEPNSPEAIKREELNISIVNSVLDRMERIAVRDGKTNPEKGQ
ncbi:MAG: hypothetical protein AAFQ27_01570 [Pseudomonadota bacterium]